MLNQLLRAIKKKTSRLLLNLSLRLNGDDSLNLSPSLAPDSFAGRFRNLLLLYQAVFPEYARKLPNFSERDLNELPGILAQLCDNPDELRERLDCLRACWSVLIPSHRFCVNPVDERALGEAKLFFCRFMEEPDFGLNRFNALVAVGRLIYPDYRFIWPQYDWWYDDEFNRYLDKFGELRGMNTERKWNLSELMKLVAQVPGDTVECGVYQGASSYVMCKANSISELDKTHHIFDSFEGVSAPGENDGEHWKKGDLSAGEPLVNDNLKEFAGFFKTYAGWIPGRFPEVADRKFCFVHLDVDLYEPTRDSLEFFYPRLNAGAVILCDDYGSTICPGATKAVDEFLAGKPEIMVSFASGGGFLIKK